MKLYYKRIGNLCLMRASDNCAAKSDGLPQKQPMLAASPYVLTNQIAEVPGWTAATITERQRALAAVAVRTWPI